MPILLAAEVMDLAAAALNDVNKTRYTYDIQIPYLKLALQELQEIYELNSLPITEKTSKSIPINAGVTELRFNAPSEPRLPDNLIEPEELWERTRDTNPFVPMRRRDYLPHGLEGNEISQLIYWVWQDNKIQFLAANGDNDIKIDYIGSLFPKYVLTTTEIPVLDSIGFLAYKTAELISDMIEHNQPRAQANAGRAALSLDRITGITIKSKQQIMTRRRPFRQAFKRLGWY